LIQEEIKRRLNLGNPCYLSVQNLLTSHLVSKNLKTRIYKTIILPVIVCGCETWSLTVREEHRLRVFENIVLRKIFGSKRNEMMGGWSKLHNEELHNLVLVGKPEGKRPLGRPRCGFVDDVKMDLTDIGWSCMDRIMLLGIGTSGGPM
jgi:hypothetical protein